MPKVSIVIPCYNQGQYVNDAVESVLNQTFQDFEIIIVNDGSTDSKTNQILKDYNKPKTLVISTENQGLSEARNNGIKASSGEYILPLDADDKIHPEYIKKAVEVIESNSKIGIVYSEAEFFGTKDEKWNLPEYNFKDFIKGNCIFCSALYRKSDWKKVGGYKKEMNKGFEDWEFWISLIEAGAEVYKIPEILFCYRQYENSMSQYNHITYAESIEKIKMFHPKIYAN